MWQVQETIIDSANGNENSCFEFSTGEEAWTFYNNQILLWGIAKRSHIVMLGILRERASDPGYLRMLDAFRFEPNV